jgi:hypothetical protein
VDTKFNGIFCSGLNDDSLAFGLAAGLDPPLLLAPLSLLLLL